MDKGIKFSSVASTGAMILALSLAGLKTAKAAEEVCNDMPNPFAPTAVHTESRGSKWRHAFHDMRTTVMDKVKVYPDELEGFEKDTFEKIQADPAFFLDRKIEFDVYFGKPGTFYRPFVSPFSQDQFTNFSAWGYGAELWTKAGRSTIHPLFYIDKRRGPLIDKLAHFPMYTPLRIKAEIRSKTDNMPWCEVIGVEVIPEAVLSVESIRQIDLAVNQAAKKRYDLATQALEAAIAMELPLNAETKAYGLLGRSYYELRNYSQARNALVNSVLRDNKNVENLILLARTDLRLERADEGKQAAASAIALEPANPLAHAEMGLALAMLNDVRGGYHELDVAQKLARNQLPEAHRNRAVIAFREGKLAVSENELKQAVLFRPTDVDLKLELGDVYLAMGDADKAKAEYAQARDLALTRSEPFYKLAVLQKKQADALKKDGKDDAAKKLYEDALENVKNAIQRDDQFTPAYGLQAEILRALGKAEEAKKVLDAGSQIKGNLPRMQEYIYQQAATLGDWPVMEETTRTMLAKKPTADLYSRLGNVLASKPNPDMNGAAAALATAVQLDAARSNDWAALGHIRLQYLGDNTGALAALNQVVALDAKDGLAWQEMAIANRNLGNSDQAVKSADQAVALTNSVSARITAAMARLDRGSEGDVAAAAELAQKAQPDAATDMDKAWVNAILAVSASKAGKTQEAVELFSKADALAAGSPEFNLWYGQALLNAGVAVGAEDHLRSAFNMTLDKAKFSPLAARINAEAAQGLKAAAVAAVTQPKPVDPAIAPATVKAEESKKEIEPTKTSTKKEAPVIEEPEGQSTPAKVPQP